MPTARELQAGTKRQKTTAAALVLLDSAECVSYDALEDEDYPLARIEEHLLRLLAYEPSEGIAEVLALAVRSIGCNIKIQITGLGAGSSEIVSEVELLEESCLNSSTGCPSTYAMQRLGFVKRVRAMLISVVQKLDEADNADVVLALARYTAVLTTARLQSLRYTSTVFAGSLVQSLDRKSTAAASLLRALNERTADVSPLIRKTAITDIANTGDTSAAVRAYNDPIGSVRVAAIRALAAIPGDVDMNDSAWKRMIQLAQQDTELAVRRTALKFLVLKGTERDADLLNMLIDADAQSRNSAATFVIRQLSERTESPWALLVSIATTAAGVIRGSSSDKAISALVLALEKQKQKFQVNWLEELGNLLTQDLHKEARNSFLSAESKKQYRSLAVELENITIQRNLLALYAGIANSTSAGSGTTMLNVLPRLISRLRFDDDLLAEAIRIASYLPSEKLLSRPDSEKRFQELFRQILDLLSERSAVSVARAASQAFAALPDSHRLLLLRDAYHDLRLKLATYLGPRGEVNAKKESAVSHIIVQLLVLARFLDISDLAKLPLWPLLMKGNLQMKQLVRALGMKGNVELAGVCVEKLMLLPSGPAIDEILQIHVSAKMRGIDLGQLPFDINEQPPSKEIVWTAAVAAGVI